MRIQADKNLAFYPTDEYECRRLLAVLGKFDIKYEFYDVAKQLGKVYSDFPSSYGYSNDKALRNKQYLWMLDNRPEDVERYFTYEVGGYTYNETPPLTVADLFAGEGEWLKTFKNFVPTKTAISFIGNEIEEGRFKKAKKNLQYCFNDAFEELQIPSDSISLMLYNPPYGSTNGERNALRYLRMILERKYLIESEKDYYGNSVNGIMIFVLRKDDVEICLETIVKNFDIITMYKVNPEEYEKWKQFIVIARLKQASKILSGNAAISFQHEYEKIKKLLDAEQTFHPSMCELNEKCAMPRAEFEKLYSNHQFSLKKELYVSNPKDRLWSWAEKNTEVKDFGVESITMPKPPTMSEIANIIAGGYINGSFELDSGSHLAIGGTKTLETEEINLTKDDDGGTIKETKLIRKSLPYLNVAYSDPATGKLSFKELGA